MTKLGFKVWLDRDADDGSDANEVAIPDDLHISDALVECAKWLEDTAIEMSKLFSGGCREWSVEFNSGPDGHYPSVSLGTTRVLPKVVNAYWDHELVSPNVDVDDFKLETTETFSKCAEWLRKNAEALADAFKGEQWSVRFVSGGDGMFPNVTVCVNDESVDLISGYGSDAMLSNGVEL